MIFPHKCINFECLNCNPELNNKKKQNIPSSLKSYLNVSLKILQEIISFPFMASTGKKKTFMMPIYSLSYSNSRINLLKFSPTFLKLNYIN